MKKGFIGFVLLTILSIGMTLNVNAAEASDIAYTTAKGINLTKEEYTFLKTFYWEGYPDIMTEEQYEKFKNSDLLTRELRVKSVKIPTGNSKSSSHSTTYKTLSIAAACNTSNCDVTINCSWTYDPAIRSYDVIGAYLSGVSYVGHIWTYVASTNGSSSYSNIKTAWNGYGNSVKLPDTGSSIVVNTNFTTTRGGVIYGSYQHAMSNTTLAVSKKYTFSLGGYGNVFSFYGAAAGVYDGMAGVDLSV